MLIFKYQCFRIELLIAIDLLKQCMYIYTLHCISTWLTLVDSVLSRESLFALVLCVNMRDKPSRYGWISAAGLNGVMLTGAILFRIYTLSLLISVSISILWILSVKMLPWFVVSNNSWISYVHLAIIY